MVRRVLWNSQTDSHEGSLVVGGSGIKGRTDMAGGVAESMDPLAQLWDDEEGQEEEEEDDENEESAAHEEEQGPTRKELRFEDIQAKGYERWGVRIAGVDSPA